jgi:hypothetical protein
MSLYRVMMMKATCPSRESSSIIIQCISEMCSEDTVADAVATRRPSKTQHLFAVLVVASLAERERHVAVLDHMLDLLPH